MRKTILFAAVALLVSTTAAVESYNGSTDQPHITGGGSSSSASGSVAAGPNGTEWGSTVGMRDRNPDVSIGEKVENITFTGDSTDFSGYIQAPTPCHVINTETEKTGDSSYRVNIETVKEDQDKMCVQQVVMIRYKGEFRAETPYTLEIQHNNQTVDTIENTETESPDSTDSGQKDLIDGFISWLSRLF